MISLEWIPHFSQATSHDFCFSKYKEHIIAGWFASFKGVLVGVVLNCLPSEFTMTMASTNKSFIVNYS